MLIKSSMETLELAFDRVEYCCKKLFKSEEGGRYNKWYCYGAEFGQDYAWFKVEHTDYSVRLSFEFMDTGFVYVDGYFTNGSSYDKKTITSWKFDSESEDATADKVKDILDRFFDEGINVLRGEEVYNSKKNIQSAKKPVKSANEKETVYEVYYPYGSGIKEPWTTTDRDVAMRMKKNGAKVKVRKAVKSSFVVGKQNNGNKVYFCEDGQYYPENDYSRPSIKIFNSKQEADKIAKRSKNGFVSPLEK